MKTLKQQKAEMERAAVEAALLQTHSEEKSR